MSIRVNGAGGGAPLSDATPAAPGTAAAGTSSLASRGDHVHTPTTAAQAGAVPTTRTVAGISLAADISTPSLKTALGITTQAVPTPLFEAGNSWLLVAPTVGGTAATSAVTYTTGTDGLPGVARVTMTSDSIGLGVTNLMGPRIERAVTWDATKRWRIRVTPVGGTMPVTYGGISGVWLYLRDGASGLFQVRVLNFTYYDTYSWSGGTREIRVGRDNYAVEGRVSSAGVWTQTASTSPVALSFTPTHVGLVGAYGGDCRNYYDLRDLIIESFV